MISISCEMTAVFASIAVAEQYFSADRFTARSTFFGSSPRPLMR